LDKRSGLRVGYQREVGIIGHVSAALWVPTLVVFFGPGLGISYLAWRRRHTHRVLLARIEPYSHMSRRRG